MTANLPGAPPAPAGTAEIFGSRWASAARYADLLCTEGVLQGVVGPREVDRIWTRHVRNSLAVQPFVPEGLRVVDLGSGAGLPGIPLALSRPDLDVVLLEPLARRVRFLTQVREALDLPVHIEQARAENTAIRAEVVVCRAVAPLIRLVPLAYGLTKGQGRLVALKGRTIQDEISEMDAVIGRESPAWAPVRSEAVSVSWPDPALVFVAEWRKSGKQGEDPTGKPSDSRHQGRGR